MSIKGWKHACQCTKCKGIKFINESTMEKSFDTAIDMEENKKSDCCNASYEYIGLRPEKEHILNIPVDNDRIALVIEKTEKDLGSVGSIETFKPVKVQTNNESDIKSKNDTDTDLENNADLENNIKLENIIDINRKMSGRYMTEIIRNILDNNEATANKQLNILENNYPNYFVEALKYIPKRLKNKFNLA